MSEISKLYRTLFPEPRVKVVFVTSGSPYRYKTGRGQEPTFLGGGSTREK